MKNTVLESKNTRWNKQQARGSKEQINLEERVMESNRAEQVRGKKNMQNENKLRELSDSIKCNNIHIIGIPEEERKEDRKFI